MSAEPMMAADAGTASVEEELAEEWARFRDVLWYGSIKDARATYLLDTDTLAHLHAGHPRATAEASCLSGTTTLPGSRSLWSD